MSLPPKRALPFLATCLLLAGLTTTASAAGHPMCRGTRATIVGTSGNDRIKGTSGKDVIVGLGGNDLIESLGGADIVCGGGGRDEVYGAEGNDILVGGAGSDALIGGPGNDELASGKGNDYLIGNDGDDEVSGGGGGFDYADWRTATGPVTLDLAAHRATGDGTDNVTGIEMVSGGDFDDVLSGSSGDFELFLGLGGNDTIHGREGFDQLIFDESPVGVTADIAAGRASGEGNDTFDSIESLVGSEFDDTLLGHEGSDDIYGSLGNDTIDGRGGDDYLLGNAGNDDISGGAGIYDMIDFDPGAPAVTVNATTGISTGEGTDHISGFEIIGGTQFDDTLIGDGGDQLFYPYGGNDSIDGKGGTDLVLYNVAQGPITADLSTGTASGEGADTFQAIEGLVGSDFDDSLTGDPADNALIGGPGNDELIGMGGDDYSDGGPGNDTIDGGAGTYDMADYGLASNGVTVDLAAGMASGAGNDSLAGIETIFGSPFDDLLVGDSGTNYLYGNEGNDAIDGAAGDDGLDGGDGTDELDGGVGTDGCVGGESLSGCEGTDEPPSNEAADRLQEIQAIVDGLRRHY